MNLNRSTAESPQAAAPAPQPRDAGETDLSNSTILIVDDNQQNLELIQAYLETLPCRIESAADGVEALAMVESVKPDLILLDVMMPRMSGFEVCKKLKSDPSTRTIPIIMVTALNEIGDIERGVESGTDDFLTKPVKKLELITRVKSLLRVRHLKRELDRTLAYIEQVESHEPGLGPPPPPSEATDPPNPPPAHGQPKPPDDEPADQTPPRPTNGAE